MSLYQSYRPKNFSDVVGQDFVKKILANSCKTETFHHGYIFFGFHGIGKTTLARIFAEAVNCTAITPDGNPCHACANCISYDNGKMIDVIEIDAASYTGVDNIREVIDHAKFTPTQGKYKVYIIDEVHMLSKGAFNALLKTLEEPPAHAIFLLATTEIHKVPDTILSRVIRFDLNKISEPDMQALLEKICTTEGLNYEIEALKMIVHRARGSIRDSLTMLEKCIIEKSVTEKNVEEALHLVNMNFLKETFEACISGDATAISHILGTVNNEGIDVRQFASQMTEWIVDTIEVAFEQKMFPLYKEIFDLFTRVFVQSKQVAVPMDVLKMTLYERIKTGKLEKKDDDQSPPTQAEKEETVAHIIPHQPEPQVEKIEKIQTPHTIESEPEEEAVTSASIVIDGGVFSSEAYIRKLQELGIKSTLIPLLKTAGITIDDDTLTIVTTSFCQSRCAEGRIRQVLEDAAQSFFATKINIITPTDTSSPEPE